MYISLDTHGDHHLNANCPRQLDYDPLQQNSQNTTLDLAMCIGMDPDTGAMVWDEL